MASIDEILAIANSDAPTGEPEREQPPEAGRPIGEILAIANDEPDSYQPPLRPTQRPGEQVTILVGNQMVPAEETLFAKLPSPFRRAIAAGATIGATIENPISRLFGTGELAAKNRRALENLRRYNQELDKDAVLGETVSPVVGDVVESLAVGTLAAPFGGPVARGASPAQQAAAATRQLTATSMAFGLDGMDRVYQEQLDMGRPKQQAASAAARQFMIDGVGTFAGGKLVMAAGFNPGRYFGSTIARTADRTATRSGLKQVLGSAALDSGVEGVQGGLSYLNGAYSGTHDFEFGDFAKTIGVSVAAGGLAGGLTAGAEVGSQRLNAAFNKFQGDLPKAVQGAKDASDFVSNAEAQVIEQARTAKTAKEFEQATGQKGKDAVYRESFQEELGVLQSLQTELARKGVEVQRSLEIEERALQRRREETEAKAAEFEQVERSLQESGEAATPAQRAEIARFRQEVEAERKAIQDDFEELNRRRQETEGEEAEFQAYLESKLDRIAAQEQDRDPGRPTTEEEQRSQDEFRRTDDPPERRRTPANIAKQFDDLDFAQLEIAEATRTTFDGQTLDNATKRDLGRLIDAHAQGQESRVALFEALSKARTPGETRQVLSRLSKQLDKSARRLARRDFDEAAKQAQDVREEFRETVTQAVEGVNRNSTDSLRDAAEALREAKYQSDMADTFLTQQTAKRISETAGQIVEEVKKAMPLRMKSDDIVRVTLGQETPGLDISRDFVTADSPLIRELASRPEVQLTRLGDTLRTNVWERSIEAQSQLDLANKEVTEGLAAQFEALGLPIDTSITATLGSLARPGRGTRLERWRNELRDLDGVRMSRDEAVGLALLDMDPRNAEVLGRRGFRFPDGREIPTFTERFRNQLRDFVGDEGLALADWMFRYNNGPLIDRVNDSRQQLTGRPLTTKRNVTPRVLDKQWEITGIGTQGLTDATLNSYPHLRRRTGTDKALTWPEDTTGGIDYFLRHAERMNRVAAFSAPARDIEVLLNRPEVERAIRSRDGKEGLDNIREAVRIQVNGPQPVRGATRIIARLNAVNAAATLGFRVTTMAIQGMSTIASFAYRPRGIRSFLRALPALASRDTLQRMENTLGAGSGHWWERYVADGFAGQQTSGIYRDTKGRLRPPSLAQHALRPLKETERVVNSVVRFVAAEQTALQSGLTPDSPDWVPFVSREWERATYRGENTSMGIELSGMLRAGRDNPAFGTLLTFQSTASKIYSLGIRALDLLDVGRYKEAIGVFSVLLAAQLPVSMLREAMSRENEDEDEPFLKSVGNRAIQDAASLHPLGNAALVPIIREMQGLRQFGGSPSPLIQNMQRTVLAVGDLATGFQDAGDAAEDPREMAEDMWRKTLPLLTLLGLPVQGPDDFRRRLRDGTVFPGLRRQPGEPEFTEVVDALTVGELTEPDPEARAGRFLGQERGRPQPEPQHPATLQRAPEPAPPSQIEEMPSLDPADPGFRNERGQIDVTIADLGGLFLVLPKTVEGTRITDDAAMERFSNEGGHLGIFRSRGAAEQFVRHLNQQAQQ